MLIEAKKIKAKAIRCIGITASRIKIAGEAVWEWLYGELFDPDSEQLLDSAGDVIMCKDHKIKA